MTFRFVFRACCTYGGGEILSAPARGGEESSPPLLFSNARFFCALLITASSAWSQPVQHGLRVPAGFEVAEYADSSLANDIYTMTIDPKGRIVVAGRGYIRVLVDKAGKGKADSFISFADTPKDGAM